MGDPKVTRDHLVAFLEIADTRSIQAAARAHGRSRATYGRLLADLESAFGEVELLRRAPGLRSGTLTPAGEELAQRARLLLRHWEQWIVATRDALDLRQRAVRVGALAGTLDLISDLLVELRRADPTLPVHVVEYADEELVSGVLSGDVDLGFGTLDPGGVPPPLRFETIGELAWVLIVPSEQRARWPAVVPLRALDGEPMVLPRAGPARIALDRAFADFPSQPIHPHAVAQVGSMPRVVEAVARGFGVAIVSHFRAAFLPEGVEVRTLEGAPPPLVAGAYARVSDTIEGVGAELLARARGRFAELRRRDAAAAERAPAVAA
ncbi:MAG: LysR family transcriptional regulator [Nannocystaceae bacterium]